MQVEFIPIKTQEQIEELAQLADKIWHEHFAAIISPEQIDYMVDVFQSYNAINEQLQRMGYSYYFVCVGDKNVGYFGIKQDGNKLFLSKLYIMKDYRGKGYASETFNYLEQMCREQQLKAIWLTVNRNNEIPIKVYEKKGFKTVSTQLADIGNGYVMDDYIMEKEL